MKQRAVGKAVAGVVQVLVDGGTVDGLKRQEALRKSATEPTPEDWQRGLTQRRDYTQTQKNTGTREVL